MYGQQQNTTSDNLAVVKEYFGRGKVLGIGIMHLITLLLGIGGLVIALIEPGQVGSSPLQMLSGFNVNLSGVFGGSIESYKIITAIGSGFQILIVFLNALAFILMYAGSRKKQGSPMAGLTIMYVLSIIALVFVIIAVVAVFVVMVVGIIGSATLMPEILRGFGLSSSYSSDFIGIYILAMLLVTGAMVVVMLYYIHQVRFYGSARSSMGMFGLKANGATGFGVMNIIFAVFGVVSLVFTFIAGIGLISSYSHFVGTVPTPYIISAVITMASALLSLIIMIMYAALALGYKSHIKNAKLNSEYQGGYGYGYGYGGGYGGYGQGYPSNPYGQPYQQGYNAPQKPYANPYQQSYNAPQKPYANDDNYIPAHSYTPERVDLNSAEPETMAFYEPEPASNNAFENTGEIPVIKEADAEPEPEFLPFGQTEETAEPIAEPEPEPAPEPIAEPVAEPVVEAAPEPAVSAPNFCPNCGTKVFPGSVFCTNCGYRLR